MNLTTKEKLEKVKDLRPIDDVLFEVLAANPKVCQEILRVIMEDEQLIVSDVTVQANEQNIYGRSVRLDALCTLKNGIKCNIEVQRADSDNHLKRARYNASMITVKESQPGTQFDEVLELYVVYISEFDFLRGAKTIYHVDKVLRETGTIVDDGLHEIFVNTVIDDGTDISELMSCFLKKEINDPKFPVLTSEVQRLKESEGGASAVCEVMQKYEKIAEEKGLKQGLKKGLEQGQMLTFITLIKDGILSKEDAAKRLGITLEDFKTKEKEYV